MFTSYGHIKKLVILAWASPFKIIYLNAVLHIYTFTVTAKVVLSTPVHLALVDAIVTEDQFSLFIKLFYRNSPSKLRERLEDELVAASGERDGLLKDAIDYAKDTAFTEQRGKQVKTWPSPKSM